MKMYFPSMVEEDLNFLENRRRYALAIIEQELNPSEENLQVIKVLEEIFLEQLKPLQFMIRNGSNVVIDRQKEFDRGCMSIKEMGIDNAREMTMYEFRILLETQQDKAEKQKNHGTTELS